MAIVNTLLAIAHQTDNLQPVTQRYALDPNTVSIWAMKPFPERAAAAQDCLTTLLV
jgi:hypothetical protein